jgi:hypothetical protein
MISCNALDGISTPQTLKIKGYIKKKKVIVLIDSGSTHNFIHYKLFKALNCFVYPMPKFQVMILDGGTINCSGKWNKINLTMGEYVMNSPIIDIPIGGVDVLLGIQWLQSLGTMDFNFQELFMKCSLEGNKIELRGITGKPGKVISSNGMTKLLKKGHQGIIAQLFSLYVQTSKPSIPQDLQGSIDKNSKLFEDIPKGLPPTRNHDHEIHLIPGSVPPNIRPYRYPYTRKSEIERMIEEMLEVEGPRHTGSFLSLARRTLNGSSISLSGNLHPQQTLTGSPLYTWEIGLRNFANPVVERWSLESPKPETVNADLFFSFRDFPYRDFGDRDVEKLVSSTPESRFAETLIHSRALTFQRHFTSSALRTSQYRES